MDEEARQSTSDSNGRRRRKCTILNVAGITFALILGGLGYLVYHIVSTCVFRNILKCSTCLKSLTQSSLAQCTCGQINRLMLW